jgi:hypothetical protein
MDFAWFSDENAGIEDDGLRGHWTDSPSTNRLLALLTVSHQEPDRL